MKQIIRLTESDLHRLVKESVRRILAETDASAAGGGALGGCNIMNGTSDESGGIAYPFGGGAKNKGKVGGNPFNQAPLVRQASPVGEPTNKKEKGLDMSDALDRKGGKNHSIAMNHVGGKKKVNETKDETLPSLTSSPLYDRDKWKEAVKKDRERLDKLKWGDEFENHPNRRFLNSEIRFDVCSTYLEEAAFQLLGIDRFAIAGNFFPEKEGIMPNPWNDLFDILNWAVKYKGLNPIYLRKVSNRDWQAEKNNKLGMKPEIMPSDDWYDYTTSVENGEQRIFTSEELRDISSHLPLSLKKDLYNDLINVSRIGLVGEMIDHILAMNDGENAVQFCNAVRSRIYQLKGAGFNANKLNDNRALRVIVADALKETPELQTVQKYISKGYDRLRSK